MRVVKDDLLLCLDCMIAAVNGDVTGIESEERVAAVWAGLEKAGPRLVPNFDSESGDGVEEFSWRGCWCCETKLGGSRYRFAVLGDTP